MRAVVLVDRFRNFVLLTFWTAFPLMVSGGCTLQQRGVLKTSVLNFLINSCGITVFNAKLKSMHNSLTCESLFSRCVNIRCRTVDIICGPVCISEWFCCWWEDASEDFFGTVMMVAHLKHLGTTDRCRDIKDVFSFTAHSRCFIWSCNLEGLILAGVRHRACKSGCCFKAKNKCP